jgi:hypothetical protein
MCIYPIELSRLSVFIDLHKGLCYHFLYHTELRLCENRDKPATVLAMPAPAGAAIMTFLAK